MFLSRFLHGEPHFRVSVFSTSAIKGCCFYYWLLKRFNILLRDHFDYLSCCLLSSIDNGLFLIIFNGFLRHGDSQRRPLLSNMLFTFLINFGHNIEFFLTSSEAISLLTVATTAAQYTVVSSSIGF